MIRALTLTLAALCTTPLLLLGGTGSTGSFPPPAAPGGTDAQQLQAVPAELRGSFATAAREFVLAPALLAAVAKVASNFDPTMISAAGPDGPARGLMQFTARAWARYNTVPGASPFEPGPAVRAQARQLLAVGALPGGGWDPARALLGLAGTGGFAERVLTVAAGYGYRYSPAGPPLDPDRYAFPLTGTPNYGPVHHDYPATDLFTPIGTPVRACVRALLLRLSRTDTGKGGLSVTLRGEDGWRYYYAHLSALDPQLRPGMVLEAGQILGRSGDTGSARGTPPHLHFGISLTGNAQGQLPPFPYLQLWQQARLGVAAGPAR
jgi:murein DD-endopeptidase MepM/ murein hydrolase activator NlpD